MSQSSTIWIVILAACIAANLPFSSDRIFGIGPLLHPYKSLLVSILEFFFLYFLVGGSALLLEKNSGQIYPQGWEFYVVTLVLFIAMAFPGFVYKFLIHKHK